jgi:hypothetical protein
MKVTVCSKMFRSGTGNSNGQLIKALRRVSKILQCLLHTVADVSLE